MAGGITSVGVGSGLDLENLITGIVTAERTPTENRLNLREAQATASISALGSLKSSLADFQGALAKLKDASAFSARSATSSDSTLFKASAGATAELGSHAIEVIQLAQTHKLASADFSDPAANIGAGSLTFTVGGKSMTLDIEAGVNDTVAGLRDAINNASDNPGLRASLLTVSDGAGGTATKLVFTATESGTAGAIEIEATDSDADDGFDLTQFNFPPNGSGTLTEASAARNAQITIDGFLAESSTNEFTDAITGVTITALKASEADAGPAQLIVSENKTGIKSAIEGFVANYNALMTVLNQLTAYDPGTQTRGLLSGDASIKVIESRVRSALTSTVEGAASDFNALAFLGIATNRDGSISLDNARLDKALSERYEDVAALFSGEKGVATRLDGVISELTQAGGVFDTRNETLQKQLRDISEQREQLAMRLEKIETRYRSQFAMLNILVAQFNQTGSFLQQQLEASAKIINRDK